jgi:hypothetical protein
MEFFQISSNPSPTLPLSRKGDLTRLHYCSSLIKEGDHVVVEDLGMPKAGVFVIVESVDNHSVLLCSLHPAQLGRSPLTGSKNIIWIFSPVRGWSKLTRLAEAGGVSKNFY